MEVNAELFEDYARFHEIQMMNRDVDPVYPVLRQLADDLGWTPEERVRAVFLHVAYYDLGSALAALDRRNGAFLRAFTEPVPGLRCGTERRRHRMGTNLRDHLVDLHEIASMWNGLETWVTVNLTMSPAENWQFLTAELMTVNGNGRWAAYKTCEMLAEVCGLPLTAPDMGHKCSTGPRQGLALLYPAASALGGSARSIAQLDRYSAHLVGMLQARGLQAGMATAETTLCDFHSMHAGRYYPGLDIDIMMEQLTRASAGACMKNAAFAAREKMLPYAYLGEFNGWQVPDAKRKRVYKLTGKIPVRD